MESRSRFTRSVNVDPSHTVFLAHSHFLFYHKQNNRATVFCILIGKMLVKLRCRLEGDEKRGNLRNPLASLRCGTDAKGANASCDGNSGHEAPSVPDGVCEETGTADRVRCAGVSIIWAFQKAGKDGLSDFFGQAESRMPMAPGSCCRLGRGPGKEVSQDTFHAVAPALRLQRKAYRFLKKSMVLL